MSTPPEASVAVSWKSALRALVGLLVGGLLLWVASRKVDGEALLAAASTVDPAWIGAAVALYVLDIGLRVRRWMLLLRPVAPLGYSQVAEVLVVGYAANNILPARLGELFRADFIKRRNGVSRAAALGTILVERLCDGFIAIALLDVGLLHLSSISSPLLYKLGWLVSICVLVLVAGVIAVAANRSYVSHIKWEWIRSRLVEFTQTISHSAAVIPAVVLYSLVISASEILVFVAILQSVGVTLPVMGLMLMVGAVTLSTVLPTAPGYVGSYQLAFVLAVAPFGVSATSAVLAATLIQVFLLGGLSLVGILVYFLRHDFFRGALDRMVRGRQD